MTGWWKAPLLAAALATPLLPGVAESEPDPLQEPMRRLSP